MNRMEINIEAPGSAYQHQTQYNKFFYYNRRPNTRDYEFEENCFGKISRSQLTIPQNGFKDFSIDTILGTPEYQPTFSKHYPNNSHSFFPCLFGSPKNYPSPPPPSCSISHVNHSQSYPNSPFIYSPFENPEFSRSLSVNFPCSNVSNANWNRVDIPKNCMDLRPFRPNDRRHRPTFDTRQIDELEKIFNSNKYVYGSERAQLAKKLRMTDKQVKIWFQNKRSKLRKLKNSPSSL